MEYHAEGPLKGQIKQPSSEKYPQQLYKKGGAIILVNNAEEKQAALEAGASTKVWDKEKHA